jgi:hypothetical protein
MSTIAGVVIVVLLGVCLIGVEQPAFGDEHAEGEHDFSLSLISLVRPLGIGALGLLLITFLTGLFRRKLGRRFLSIHKIFAFMTVVIGLVHGLLVLVLF